MIRLRLFVVAVVALLTCPPIARADDLTTLRKRLADRGIKVVSSRVVLESESELNSELKQVPKLRRDVVESSKKYNQHKQRMAEAEAVQTQLQLQTTQLNAQLANVQDVVTNNRLVGAINALQGQLQLIESEVKQMKTQETELRTKMSAAREAYLGRVLELRALADAVTEKYESLAKDETIQKLLADYDAAANTQLKLEPSSSFAVNLRKLTEVESSVLSESIPLRREGNTFYVNATFNGKFVNELIVDSGANLVTLPYEVAKRCDLEPTAAHPSIMLSLADGRTISGKLITIPAVRVGKFTVNDVPCAVLGPEASNAPPLLGMTFLGNFKFELNAADSTLSMVQIETPETSSAPRRR